MERESQSAYSRLKASGLLDALQGQVAEANLQRFCQLLEQALPTIRRWAAPRTRRMTPCAFGPIRAWAFRPAS